MKKSLKALNLAPVLQRLDRIAVTDVVWLEEIAVSEVEVRQLVYGQLKARHRYFNLK